MPISLTYIAVVILTYLGLDDAQNFVDAVVVVVTGLAALYGRWRAGGLTWTGLRK